MRNLYQTIHPDSLRYYVTVGIACVFLYAYLVILVRVTGARTLARLSGLDFVVTIALGTIFGGAILFERLPEGVVALTIVAALHLLLQLAAVRWIAVSRFIAHEPATLAREGRIFERVLQRERITRAELESAARAAGCSSLDDVETATLEPNGSIAIVKRPTPSGESRPVHPEDGQVPAFRGE